MRIIHSEDNMWMHISNEAEINKLLENYDFNNTWIDEINFVRSRHIRYIDDKNQCGCSIDIPDAMILRFDAYMELERYKCATIKRIEILFGNIDQMHFFSEDKHDREFLDTVLIKFSDGYFYFGETVGFDEQNEYGYPKDATWLRCEKMFWRKIDYSIDI